VTKLKDLKIDTAAIENQMNNEGVLTYNGSSQYNIGPLSQTMRTTEKNNLHDFQYNKNLDNALKALESMKENSSVIPGPFHAL